MGRGGAQLGRRWGAGRCGCGCFPENLLRPLSREVYGRFPVGGGVKLHATLRFRFRVRLSFCGISKGFGLHLRLHGRRLDFNGDVAVAIAVRAATCICVVIDDVDVIRLGGVLG